MLGYVKPLKGQLRVFEWEHYQAVYCGLCHALRKKYGFWARFLVHYDFTFYALLLSNGTQPACKKRCVVHPLKKRCVVSFDENMEKAADATVIMMYWKLDDGVWDNSFLKGLPYRLGRQWLKKKRIKAEKSLPVSAKTSMESLERLRDLEKSNSSCLDAAADTFAGMLSAFAEADGEDRALKSLLYHVGRWIYILDAYDDLSEDFKEKRYNPIAARYGMTGNGISETARDSIITTLAFSRDAAFNAFILRDSGSNQAIIENILQYGMVKAERDVFFPSAKPEGENT